jgi:hypothetical protein
MIGDEALGEFSLGEARNPYAGDIPTAVFDWFATVISQYANSPILLKLIANMAEYIDPTANFDAFFTLVFNVDTAVGYGLDVWGRIVGVSRVLRLPGDAQYFGFSESTDGYPFDEGIFFGGGVLTSNFSLSDAAYRKLILAKALANISDGSIPGINQILINLFGNYGNCYVTDGGNMTMTYTFGATLSVVDFAIVAQSGVLPRPAGVSVTIVQL